MEMQNLRMGTSYRSIVRMALPISFAILIPQLNFFINTIFLGTLGEESLALAGITGVYYLIFTAMGTGINNGLQVLIARRAGQNLPEEVGRLFLQGIRLVLLLSALAVLITYFLLPSVLHQVLNDDGKSDKAVYFLQIRIWGLPFLYLFQMSNALLVGINRSRFLPYGSGMGTAINIALDYCLIYGAAGLPQLGFNGAAWASVVSEVVSMLVMLVVVRKVTTGRGILLPGAWRFNWERTRLIFKQSVPLMFQHAISIISWWFFFLLIGRMENNTRTLAISQTMRNVFGLFSIATWALGSTANAMVSNIIGQNRREEVIPLTRRIAHLSFAVAVFCCIILNLFPGAIFSLFNTQGDFIAEAVPVIRVVSVALLLMSFAVTWLNAVVGTGSSQYALLLETITILLYCIYVYVVMEVYHLSVTIGWMSEWLYWSVLLSASWLFMRSGKWKEKRI